MYTNTQCFFLAFVLYGRCLVTGIVPVIDNFLKMHVEYLPSVFVILKQHKGNRMNPRPGLLG